MRYVRSNVYATYHLLPHLTIEVKLTYSNIQLTSQTAKRMGRIIGQQMVERFLAESKKALELAGGVESLPTVQTLCLIYLTTALLGRDRAGLMYRYAAYEVLKRQRLDVRFAKLNDDDPEGGRTRVILSKVAWGLFCFEGCA